MDYKSLLKVSSFSPEILNRPDSWVGHLPFSAWLIKTLSPAVLVELGTHSGNSYFSFCQAVVENNLPTVCYAVDTWEGDEHAGFYEADVFAQVSQDNAAKYSAFSRLLRMTFDEATGYFADGSVNLLHIDGFHSYEAVAHDFTTWLPKLAPGAVVLFHDTNVRERDFGVWQFWRELQARYPNNLEFFHSHGLGVLQLNDAPESKKIPWLQPESTNKRAIIDYFASLGAQQLKRFAFNETKTEVVNLTAILSARDQSIAELNETVREKNRELDHLTQTVHVKDRTIHEKNRDAEQLTEVINGLKKQIFNLEQSLSEVFKSTSWRVTAPMRFAVVLARKGCRLWSVFQNYGWLYGARKVVHIIRYEGFLSFIERLLRFVTQQAPVVKKKSADGCQSKIRIQPYYIAPELGVAANVLEHPPTIAVHWHLYYTEMLAEFAVYLNNIPIPFDLFVSVPETADTEAINSELKRLLKNVSQVVVETVPNRGRDIAPFIVQFGERLLSYEVIAHIHTKQSPHDGRLSHWCQEILKLIMGSTGDVAHIIELLQGSAKIVFPENLVSYFRDESGWADNYPMAAEWLNNNTDFNIDDFTPIEFPEGSMYWARSHCMAPFLNLKLSYEDFPVEPIAADGTLAHVLERLVLVFANSSEGYAIRLHRKDSIQDYRYYEESVDFSASISHDDVKILAYYLPQFHPIPENDLWHGEGFTEWTKVRASNPLFAEHYQQHIPHSDIGYYLLDSPDTLKQQVALMQRSGVFGQVFYHYWFSGKLILEEPAQLLLANTDIDMPFCFCWANENWTRAWDGNTEDVLLGQDYSAADAVAFIRYLMPFFNDSRYIKIDGRPVLFIYRPASISDPQMYLDAWEQECLAAGLKKPYVVAVLTRGAQSPEPFAMDAGVERVLHDWTSGEVSPINESLDFFEPCSGSVLPYQDVVDFYCQQSQTKDFTYFRSVVPTWDNTARYGQAAYLLHGSTPALFQQWLESTIHQTQATLPKDRRFILVNAWNEWAEGAHLEPDSRFGYSYLNAIGRALSARSYQDDFNVQHQIPKGCRLHLSFPAVIVNKLATDPALKARFVAGLLQSTVFASCTVTVNVSGFLDVKSAKVQASANGADFVLEFRKIVFFGASVIEKMLMSGLASGATIIPVSYDQVLSLDQMTENGSVVATAAYHAGMVLIAQKAMVEGNKNFRRRSDAMCFVSAPKTESSSHNPPRVTTIIRVHAGADFSELQNALFSLYAMVDCVVVPFIAAQDFSPEQRQQLQSLLAELSWPKTAEPQVEFYQSDSQQRDLRSRMLNESLKKVKTRYAAFLDYDDLMMPHAYRWLLSRLQKTGKAVTFGRVYATDYDHDTQTFLARKPVYSSGYSYQDFLHYNHAPLHSFMLDLTQLDLSAVVYYDDQRFMEDYLLTLQLFTETNCDWESLTEPVYIGDYIHSVNRSHTLAINDDEERSALLSDPEYRRCEQRICDLRESIQGASS